jgi:hypothetical protein
VLGSGELRDLRDEVDTAVYTVAKREVSLRQDEFAQAVRILDAIVTLRHAA